MKLVLTIALIGLFALSFMSATSIASQKSSPLLRVGAINPTTGIFYLNLTAPLTSAAPNCLANAGAGPYPLSTSVPQPPGQWPPTAVTSASKTVSSCGLAQCPFTGGPCPFTPSTATIELWGYPSVDTGTMSGTLVDLSTGKTIYTFSGQSENFGGATDTSTCATAGELSFTIPVSTAGTINPTDTYEANFTFSNTDIAGGGTPAPPTICTGATEGWATQILLGSTTIPTPEFPLGTVLSILAPLGAVAAYVALTAKMRKPTLVK